MLQLQVKVKPFSDVNFVRRLNLPARSHGTLQSEYVNERFDLYRDIWRILKPEYKLQYLANFRKYDRFQ